jgi:hypothetical protein
MMNGFVENAKGLAKNPLGIIALFVSLIYAFACLVLSASMSNLKSEAERLPMIWFVILFPIIILLAFVYLVTNHHGKLYSPSDYGNTESFMKTIEGAKKFDAIEVEVTKDNVVSDNLIISSTSESSPITKSEAFNFNKHLFLPETKDNVDMANIFFAEFLKLYNQRKYVDKVEELSFGAQAPEYFLLRIALYKESLHRPNASSREDIIIRVTKDNSGVLNMIGIGKDILETDPKEFAVKALTYIDRFVYRATRKAAGQENE